MADTLNDSLDDLFNSVGAPVERPLTEKAKEHQEAVKAGYFDQCRKCGGSGLYRAPSSYGRTCFACEGRGGKTYKTSPEERAKKRLAASGRKAARIAELAAESRKAADDWRVKNPEAAAWLAKGASDFARSLTAGLDKFGSLTDGQLAAVLKCIERDKERAAERGERAKNAPEAKAYKLHEAFRAAKKSGLRNLKIRIDGYTFLPAGPASRWHGSIYVKRHQVYLGRVTDGRFFGSFDCTSEDQARVLEIMADPAKAAVAHGLKTGECSCCGATLTNQESVRLGIGPICRSRFGW